MSLENWELDRAQLQAVLDDLMSGQIRLREGQDEYVTKLRWRLQQLDEMPESQRRA